MPFIDQIIAAIDDCGMNCRQISLKSIVMADTDGGVILDEPALSTFRKTGAGMGLRRVARLADIIGLQAVLKEEKPVCL